LSYHHASGRDGRSGINANFIGGHDEQILVLLAYEVIDIAIAIWIAIMWWQIVAARLAGRFWILCA